MPTQLDNLALEFIELEQRRANGDAAFAPGNDAVISGAVSAAERSNWNVTAADVGRIEAALADGQPFTDPAIQTKNSSLAQINDAVRRIKAGDVSKYSHVPQFLREYYGRKALAEVFGPALEFPPLDDSLKQKLEQWAVRPEFRDALSRLIGRNAVDEEGKRVAGRLKEYDTYLNERLLVDTLKPVSQEAAERIRRKYPGVQGERMLSENSDKQCFLAKSLLMAQLGRLDITEENGTRRPYLGSTAELFSHGARTAFTLPQGEQKHQDLMYDAWRKNALDRGVMIKGRFASHEMHRRQVDAEGNVTKPFEEVQLRWKKQLKSLQLNKKATTYFGNFGMNVPTGGMGRVFNGTDCIDDRGGFGHMYMRTRKGDPTHCGSIMMGFENSQPGQESSIGQLHNIKAVSYDVSPFFSSKAGVGRKYGGREVDLSHMTPADLTGVLTDFQRGYQALQERSKSSPEALRQMEELNQKLCGERLTAPELVKLLTDLGITRENAVRCAVTGRSPRDAGYTEEAASYREEMYIAEPAAEKAPKAEDGAEKTSRDPRAAERERLINSILETNENGYVNTAGQKYLQYSDALRKLNALMNSYSEPDKEIGIPKVLDADGKSKLREAIEDTARLGESFLSDVRGANPKRGTGVSNTVTQLQQMLFEDYELLGAYDPEQVELSFPELQENARTRIVDFRGMDLQRLSGAQSSRLAMTVVDADGSRRDGVFTKATYVNFQEKFEKVIKLVSEEYDKVQFAWQAEAYGETLFQNGYRPNDIKSTEEMDHDDIADGMKQQLNNLIPSFRQYLIKKQESLLHVKPEDASKDLLVGYLAEKISHNKENETEDLLNELGFSPETMYPQAFTKLKQGLRLLSMDLSNRVNTTYLQLKEGERLDHRNTAMSAVASLLGVPELVARAENMKYLDEDGNVKEGTFMEFSKGMDLYADDGQENLSYICDQPFGPPAGIIKSLADLQVLDYICGNVDRHGGNLTYFADRRGVFTGVQAIDNDSSFGVSIPGENKKYNKLNGTKDLRVISASMAKKVESLSPDMLRFALRGRGLRDEELQAACTRLKDLQETLRERSITASGTKEVNEARDKLCVMQDENLNNLNIKTIAQTTRNIFNRTVDKYSQLVGRYRERYPFDPKARRWEADPLKEVGTVDRKYTAGGIADSMQGMSRAIENKVVGFRVRDLSSFLRSSDQFRNMVRAVKNAKAVADKIQTEIGADKERLDRSDYRVREQREKADQAMQKVREATETYLRKKMTEQGVKSYDQLRRRSDYEQKRIDYARKLLKEVEAYEALNNPRNEQHKEVNERVSKRERMSNVRKPKPNQGGPKI